MLRRGCSAIVWSERGMTPLPHEMCARLTLAGESAAGTGMMPGRSFGCRAMYQEFVASMQVLVAVQ